jgi:alkaline phosphatase D
LLSPNRFCPLQVYSQVGRTRTLPRADEDIARTRIAFFGCSQLPLGFFTAYG